MSWLTVLKIVGFLACPLLGGILYTEWYRHRTYSCDACRLDSTGSAHCSIPHTCPFARFRHSIYSSTKHKHTTVSEFGRKIEPKTKPKYPVVKGAKRDVRVIQSQRESINEYREQRRSSREAVQKAEEEANRQVEQRKAEIRRQGFRPVQEGRRKAEVERKREVEVHQEPWYGFRPWEEDGKLHIHLSEDDTKGRQGGFAPYRPAPADKKG